jgi:hypothetical protein
VQARPPDGAGAGVGANAGQRLGRGAAAEDEAAAVALERPGQFGHAHPQAHPGRGADAVHAFVAQEHRDHGSAALGRGVERGVVRRAQVAAEPQEDRRAVGGHGGSPEEGSGRDPSGPLRFAKGQPGSTASRAPIRRSMSSSEV